MFKTVGAIMVLIGAFTLVDNPNHWLTAAALGAGGIIVALVGRFVFDDDD